MDRFSTGRMLTAAMFAVIGVLALTVCGGEKNDSGQKKSSGATFVDSRDGKKYKKVVIGGKTWMAENLNYNDGSSKCYENSDLYCDKYGRLYSWTVAKIACPAGWHLPSDAEWTELVNYAGGEKTAGKKLKSRSGWNDGEGKSGNGTDDYGFSALPGGLGRASGKFNGDGGVGIWWSATESNADDAWYWGLSYSGEDVGRDDVVKNILLSVRCVED